MSQYQYQLAQKGCYKSCCPPACAPAAAASCCTRGKQGVQGWTGPQGPYVVLPTGGALTVTIPTTLEANWSLVYYNAVTGDLAYGVAAA